MMIAVTGDMPNVTGSRTATPADGPIPGSAPMTVPRKTPMKANSRLVGVSAMEKPSHRLLRSIGVSESQRPARDRHVEEANEHHVNEGHRAHACADCREDGQALHI